MYFFISSIYTLHIQYYVLRCTCNDLNLHLFNRGIISNTIENTYRNSRAIVVWICKNSNSVASLNCKPRCQQTFKLNMYYQQRSGQFYKNRVSSETFFVLQNGRLSSDTTFMYIIKNFSCKNNMKYSQKAEWYFFRIKFSTIFFNKWKISPVIIW